MSDSASFLARIAGAGAAAVLLAGAALADGHGGGFRGDGFRGGGGHVAAGGGSHGFAGAHGGGINHSLAPGHFGSPYYSRGFASTGYAAGYGHHGGWGGGGWHGGGWGGGYWRGGYWPRAYYGPGLSWFLPALPIGYATLWWGGAPYYYWDDAYYTWSPRDRGYVVTDPPPVADVASAEDDETPVAGGTPELYVYPRNGQSDKQTASDRFECHQWAVGQSNFDPSRSTNPTGAHAADYQRAISACLDARGYSAR